MGAFHVRCANAPVETPLNSDLCECEGQLWIAPDCKSGFSCRSRVLDGGFFIECDEGEQIDVDLRTWRWGCQVSKFLYKMYEMRQCQINVYKLLL